LYLEARDEVLVRRYKETRRPHPLAAPGRSLEEAIARERRLLAPFAQRADLRVDTSELNVHQLRALVRESLDPHRGRPGLTIQVCSFGYKRGLPMDADFVFDVRCLPNPHWHRELRPLTGKDAPVRRFLESHPEVERMFGQLLAFLHDWIPRIEEERRHLIVAIGCTGGQHRSVYLAERLGSALRERYPSVVVRHRELS
ncbi:MAG: RNase adapter RapZ, partial [Gammaproteobacteria bacterium]